MYMLLGRDGGKKKLLGRAQAWKEDLSSTEVMVPRDIDLGGCERIGRVYDVRLASLTKAASIHHFFHPI